MALLFWRRQRNTSADTIVSETAPLPVKPYAGDDGEETYAEVVLVKTAGVLPSANTIQNVTLTSADTEYFVTIPAGCKFYEWQCRTEAAVRYAHESGKVATPVAPYQTLKAGDYYYSGVLAGGRSRMLYLASGTAGVVVELTVWT